MITISSIRIYSICNKTENTQMNREEKKREELTEKEKEKDFRDKVFSQTSFHRQAMMTLAANKKEKKRKN